jgi:hypothetical protein
MQYYIKWFEEIHQKYGQGKELLDILAGVCIL